MKLKISILIVALVAITFGSTAKQTDKYEFKVLAKTGPSEQLSSTGVQKEVKIGSLLSSGNKLIVQSGSYIGLVHKSGHTMEIKDAGNYDIQTLSANLSAGHGSVSSKYIDYIINKWDDESEMLEVDYRQYLNVTGSVERGNGDMISVKLPKYVDILNQSILIQWSKIDTSSEYVLSVKNMYGKTIYKRKTKNNQLELNFQQAPFNSEEILIVNVSAGNNIISEDYALKKVPAATAEELNKELSSFKLFKYEKTSISCLALANFYEQNNLIADALVEYENARSMSPDSPQFETAYNAFLLRHAL